MKNILIILLIVVFYYIEISILNYSTGAYFITLAPVIFFYFLPKSASLSVNISLVYALGLDIAGGHRIPINVLGMLFAFAIYYLSHKKGIDFKYEKNRLLFCCLFCLLRVLIILFSGFVKIDFYHSVLAVAVNLVCVCAGFYLFSTVNKKISQL